MAARAAGDLPPAIILTGAGDPAVAAAAQAAGADDYLVKGHLDAAALERALRYTLARARQRAALAGAEAFLQGTLDALSAHLAVLDAAGTIVAVNAAWRDFARANGYVGDAGGLGENYLAICDAAAATGDPDAQAVAAAIRALVAGHDAPFMQEYPCHGPDARRWFAVRVTRSRRRWAAAHRGRPRGDHRARRGRGGAARPARLRRRHRRQPGRGRLRRGHRRAAHLPDPAAERLLGWSQAELLGRDMHAAIHARHGDGSPFAREDCPLLGVLRTGEPYRAEADHFVRRDGTIFPVAYTSAPIRAADAVTGAVLAFRDIGAQQAAEAELRASEARFRALVQQLGDVIAIADARGSCATPARRSRRPSATRPRRSSGRRCTPISTRTSTPSWARPTRGRWPTRACRARSPIAPATGTAPGAGSGRAPPASSTTRRWRAW